MNHRLWLVCVLGGSLAWGQSSLGTSATSKSPNPQEDQKSLLDAAPSTPMDAPVLTIRGFCPERASGPSAGGAVCETVITRAQFEKMAAAIRPNMNASVKQQLASLYPRLLVMSHAAEEMGLDKQSPFEQMIAFSRMQILTQGVTRKLQEQSGNVSEKDIADYYEKNSEMFEEYTLKRLMVPLWKQAASNDSAAVSVQTAGSETEMKDLADKLRVRAAAGEDFLRLQQEAFEVAGVKIASPTVSMGKVRRTSLPATQTAIFKLTPGEVSSVISDSGGHYIYKLQARDRMVLDEVNAEIRQTLEGLRAKDAVEKVQNSFSTQLNESYFGLPGAKVDH